MTIFPKTPKLSAADRERISPHLGNVRTTLKPWLATNPDTEDLKRAVLIEVERAQVHHDALRSVHRGVLALLLKAIQRNELGDIDSEILKELRPT